jgi:rod shape-determining protein MreC
VIYARVLINAPLAWNKMLLLDKGVKDGVKLNKLALCDYALIGKVVEIGPSMSKVRLITDANSKIGVMIQRNRQQGILFGTASGQCKMKYLSLDADVKEGDIVETAGFNSFFPKGIRVGTVEKVWKEPGEIYQVALVQPSVNMTRLEEVGIVE